MTTATWVLWPIVMAVLGLTGGLRARGRFGDDRRWIALGAALALAMFAAGAATGDTLAGLLIAVVYFAAYLAGAWLSVRRHERREQQLREALADMTVTDEHGNVVDTSDVQIMTPQMERQLRRSGQLPPEREAQR